MTNKQPYLASSSFDDVEDIVLQAWNRLSVVFNLSVDAGVAQAQKYLDQFDNVSRARIKSIIDYMKVNGYENTKREVINGRGNREGIWNKVQ